MTIIKRLSAICFIFGVFTNVSFADGITLKTCSWKECTEQTLSAPLNDDYACPSLDQIHNANVTSVSKYASSAKAELSDDPRWKLVVFPAWDEEGAKEVLADVNMLHTIQENPGVFLVYNPSRYCKYSNYWGTARVTAIIMKY